MEKLEVGEKYLSIKLSISDAYFPAFKNKSKKGANEPDYKGDGVAIWIKEKKVAAPEKVQPKNDL